MSLLYSVYDWLGISSDEASPDHLFWYTEESRFRKSTLFIISVVVFLFAQLMHHAVS